MTATYGGKASPADLDGLPLLEPTEAEVSALTRRYVQAVAAEHGLDLTEPPYHRTPKASLPSLLDERDREAEADFWYPEDRGDAVLSPLGDVEYVEDFIRPARIVVVAAEEGAGKSYAIDSELGIRVAVAGGSFAGTWPVIRTGPVLVMSEMHSDDDYHREDDILGALDLDRSAIRGRYFRLPLLTAAGGPPALTVPEWRTWIVTWLRERGALLLVVDTATGATQVDPWGQAIQRVYADLRAMLEAYSDLAIVLVLHLKKPNGRGDRRLSDVLGEWGRWCDVVLMLESDGPTRTKLSTYKRIRQPRHLVATKSDGLLIDPVDLDEERGPKVAPDAVLAMIAANPGKTFAELAAMLGVSKATAIRYVKDLGDRVRIGETLAESPRGRRKAGAVFLSDTELPPQTTSRTGDAVSEAVSNADSTGLPPHHLTTYIGEVVNGEAVTAPEDEGPGDGPTTRSVRGMSVSEEMGMIFGKDLDAEPDA